MSRAEMRKRESRTAVVGGIVIGSILLFGRGFPAVVRWTRAERANADELQHEAIRVAADLRAYPATRDSAQAWRLRLGDEITSLLHGATADQASASLAGSIREAAEEASVRLGSIDLRIDTTSSAVFLHHRATTDVTGDIRGISSFLSALESGATRIRVISLSISQSEPFAGPRQAETLQMNIVVEALARRPTPTGNRAPGVKGT